MRSPLPDRRRGDPDPYGSPAEAAGDLNVSLLGALPPHPHLDPPLALSQLMDPGTSYDAIVDRIELLSGQMPVKLLGCVGIQKDLLRYRLAANLARRLAENGRTVTIVEADLGRSMLATDPEQRDGLMDMLLYGCSYSAVARESGIPGLKVVTAGSHPWSGEPIHGDEWERVLEAFRRHSDVTLLTATTAIPGSVLSLMARRLDWILIACALDAGSRHEIRVGYLTLWDMDAPILGLVAERSSAGAALPAPEVDARSGSPAEPEPPQLEDETAGDRLRDLGPRESSPPETPPPGVIWDERGDLDVPGMDEEAEVVIREAHIVEADAAALWHEEVTRLRAPSVPPSGHAPFAGPERVHTTARPEGPALEPMFAAPEREEAKSPPPGDAAAAWGRAPGAAPDRTAPDTSPEPHDTFEAAWGEMETAGRRDPGESDRSLAHGVEPMGDAAASPAEKHAQDAFDWPAMVAPAFPPEAPREEVASAIDELEGELVGRRAERAAAAHSKKAARESGRESGHKPWRVLVPGAAIGIIALLLWAYQNELIQFERRPPRVPETAPSEMTEAPLSGSEGPVPASSEPASTEPGSPASAAPEREPEEPAPSPASANTPAAKTPDATTPPGTEPATTDPAPPAPPAAATGYGVHVSSFQTFAKANEDLRRYQEIGYEGIIVTVDLPGKGEWRRVMLGPYPTLGEADAVAQAIREDGISPKAEAKKLEP